MRIGIDINGVLRDTITKFDQIYDKFMIESNNVTLLNQTYEIDYSGNTEMIPIQENFEYKKLSEVTSLELDSHYLFKNKEEFYDFLYEEYAMEIFGHAPSTEMTTFNKLNEIYFDLRDEHDLIIVSNEIGRSKPASLFFLSKFGCLLEKVIFFSESTKKNMWNEIDILLTANPSLLLEVPKGKKVIKFESVYNKEIDSECEIKSISELTEILKTLK